MRNLQTMFLLQESEDPHYDLDIAMESIMDGNAYDTHFHMLRLIYDELSQIPDEKTPCSFLRFSGIANKKGYKELKKDIQLGRLTLSNPFKFNDPMDPIIKVWIDLQKKDSWDKQDKKLFKAARNALKNLRICCLADPNKLKDKFPLMWSHYADSHRGIAIMYKITDLTLRQHNYDNHLLRLCKVAYRDRKTMSDYITIDNALLAKGDCWSYEAEHRLLYFSTEDNEFKQLNEKTQKEERKDFISLDGFKIEAVYLATQINPYQESEIRAIATQRGIQVRKMKYSPSDITHLVFDEN